MGTNWRKEPTSVYYSGCELTAEVEIIKKQFLTKILRKIDTIPEKKQGRERFSFRVRARD